jgi:hypothetical protein
MGLSRAHVASWSGLEREPRMGSERGIWPERRMGKPLGLE